MPKGLFSALLAYVAWGFLPLYWKALGDIPAWEILGHRVLWSAVTLAVLLVLRKQAKAWLGAVKNGATLRLVVLCSAMISINWLVFIWAVNNGHMVETSLGYYVNPLFNVLLGVWFLKERLRGGQWAAIGLALCGVGIMTVQYGRLPWVSLVLAGTFSLYGFLKKKVRLESTIGLAWETVIVTPAALGYLMYLQAGGAAAADGLSGIRWMLLLLAGAATVMPLFFFSQAAKHLPLSTMGFIQYIGPTITLALGVLVYHETFDLTRWVSFSFIWAALAVYSASSYWLTVRTRRAAAEAAAAKPGHLPA